MAKYAIGDVQGCYTSLRRLLDKIRFNPGKDQLWLVGDLINRGPHSLAVLRFIKSLGKHAVTVLGNHDLHLLVVASGHAHLHKGDTLDAILRAPDRDELLDWLRRQKMMHADAGYAMVHAGLLPQWTIAQALKLAHEVEAALRSDDYDTFLAAMYGNKPARWRDSLKGMNRLRVITNAFTRLRVCKTDGAMEFKHKALPVALPRGYMPWFNVPARRSRRTPVIFGHWAALGYCDEHNVIGIDTGCVWGGSLTALRLSDRKLFQHARSGVQRLAPEQ